MRILVIAAHPDDEVLGVGGTLLKHKAKGDKIFVCTVTEGHEPQWTKEHVETILKEAAEVDKALGVTKRVYCNFPAVSLNTIPFGELNQKVSSVVNEVNPDVIYTHFRGDVNMDHKIIYDAVMVATRPTVSRKVTVFCFETLSSSEWGDSAFVPNTFVDIGSFIDKKIEIASMYKSEIREYPYPRSKEGIRILANKRGIDICSEYAEAFILIREVKEAE